MSPRTLSEPALLLDLLSRVRRRKWLGECLKRAESCVSTQMMGLLLWLGVIWRLQPSWAANPSTRWLVLGSIAFLPIIGAFLIGCWRYPGQLEVSLEADRHLGSDDLFTSSLCFSKRRRRTVWEQAVLDQANEIAKGLNPAQFVAIDVRPRLLALVGVSLISGACLSQSLSARPGSDTRTHTASPSPAPAVATEAVDALAIRTYLANFPAALKSTDVGSEVESLQVLIAEFEMGQRDQRRFDEGLASIAARLEPILPPIASEFDDFARLLVEHLPASQLGKVLSEGRFKDAQLALQALERRWQEPRTPLTREQLQSLRRAVEADRKRRLERSAAEAVERGRLRNEIDSLRGNPGDPANRPKTEDLSRRLERLEQRQASKERAAPAISALDRALIQAARGLMDALRAKAPFEGFELAHAELGRMDQLAQSDAQKRELLSRIERLRERLTQQGTPTKVSALNRFEGRAQGEDPKHGPKRNPSMTSSPSATSDSPAIETLPIPWFEQDTDGSGPPLGASAGNHHVSEIRGDASRSKLEPRRDALAAAKTSAEGSVSAEVVAGASVRGFVEPGYAEVFRAYTPVAEALLEQGKLPEQRRVQVRRYFELIRPR